MGEDYTYETEPTRAHPMQVAALQDANARLAARVMELETALREQCELSVTPMQQRTELERENAELYRALSATQDELDAANAKLDAVPVDAILSLYDSSPESFHLGKTLDAIGEWLCDVIPPTDEVQP